MCFLVYVVQSIYLSWYIFFSSYLLSACCGKTHLVGFVESSVYLSLVVGVRARFVCRCLIETFHRCDGENGGVVEWRGGGITFEVADDLLTYLKGCFMSTHTF